MKDKTAKQLKELAIKAVFTLEETSKAIDGLRQLKHQATALRDKIRPKLAGVLRSSNWPEDDSFFITYAGRLYGFYYYLKIKDSEELKKFPGTRELIPVLGEVNLSTYAADPKDFREVEDLDNEELRETLLNYIRNLETIEELSKDLAARDIDIDAIKGRLAEIIRVLLPLTVPDLSAFLKAVKAQDIETEDEASLIIAGEVSNTILHYSLIGSGSNFENYSINFYGVSAMPSPNKKAK
jgi:hypothetical protein